MGLWKRGTAGDKEIGIGGASLRPQGEGEPQSPGVPKGEETGFVLMGL